MLIGFTANWDDDSASSEQALLHELGCERIFSGSEGFITEDVLDFVRPGDTLVLSDITALGKSLQDVVLMAERLYKRGISIHAIRSGLIPGSAVGDNFANVCSILAEMLRASGDKVTNLKKSSGRGRPAALTPEEQARAARLLQRASVLEVARLLKVSPATIYRYFPRRHHPLRTDDANSRVPLATGLEPQATKK